MNNYFINNAKNNIFGKYYKKCIVLECNNKPFYNFLQKSSPQYCYLHKLDKMIRFGSANKCKFLNFIKYASYNFKESKNSILCNIHKYDGMINVIAKKCINNFCYTMVNNNKYKGYCLYCFINIFPDNNINIKFKTKERNVVDFILNHFNNFTWSYNKTIYDGCSKKRPDLLLDLGFQVIIIEIDENQHLPYNSSCENKRLMQLSLDINHRPLILIRFNPDQYINNNTLIKSPWIINKNNGSLIIHKDKINEWNSRLNILQDNISYYIKNESSKIILLIHLFFDD